MPVGRPRAFNIDDALDRALEVFWKKGYEGATLPDLTKAMGINRPSMYAAFGNKEALFRKTIDRYINGHACHVKEAFAEPTAKEVVRHLLTCSIDMVTSSKTPRGCFLVQGALVCGESADPLRQELIKRRFAGEAALCDRFKQAMADGDLPKETDPADLARYVFVIAHGLSVQAAGSASKAKLNKVVELALQAWPG
ncbi:MAG: TetR/AcrR family transcriptional regulator [Gemmatales bacterium]